MKRILLAAMLVGLSLRGDMIPEALFNLFPDSIVSGDKWTARVDFDATADIRHDFRRYIEPEEMYALREDGIRTNVVESVDGPSNIWTYVDIDEDEVFQTYIALVAWTNGTDRSYTSINIRSDLWGGYNPSWFDYDVMRFYVITGWTEHANNYDLEVATDKQDADALACMYAGCTQMTWLKTCYGNAWAMQVRRAIAERAKSFGEPMNEVAMMAKCDVRNVPCFPPGSDVQSYRIWASTGKAPYSKGMYVTVSGRQCYCTNAVDALLDAYGRRVGSRIRIPDSSLAICRSNDAATNSYSLFPIGIALHHADDAAEELAHFFNFCWPAETNRCTTFQTPGGNYVTSWDEFCAAYHGLKVDAWKMGIDFGVEGAASNYVYSLEHARIMAVTNLYVESYTTNYNVVHDFTEMGGGIFTNDVEITANYTNTVNVTTNDYMIGIETRIPSNSLKLLRVYQEACETESQDADKVRSWFESSAVGRSVL